MLRMLKMLGGFCLGSLVWAQAFEFGKLHPNAGGSQAESQNHSLTVVAPNAQRANGESAASGSLTLQAALESALRLHPLGRIREQQVAASRGALREASGIFDPVYSTGVEQSFAPTPLTTFQQDSIAGFKSAGLNITTFSAGASRLYGNGISAGPILELDRTRDHYLNLAGVNQSRLAYQVVLPLLRNRGAEVVGARVNAAGIQVEASVLDLTQTVSDLLTNTAAAYWELAGAQRFLEVALSSERRGQTLLENVQDLVEADRIPRNDIHQVRANLAERIATRVAAAQQMVVARQQLGLAMGLPPQSISDIPDPSQNLPELPAPPGEDAARIYTELALAQRADYLAARRRVDAERALLAQARNALRPAINLTISAGYRGLSEGVYPSSYLASVYRGVRGMDVAGGVRYEFAPRNNAALGRLAQVEASIRQAELTAADIARSVAAEVANALAGVRNARLRLEKARQSVDAFQAALDGEREKYRLGFGSLVDILTIEDRLTASLAVEVRARLDAAIELARLRRATGTLVAPGAAAPAADALAFMTYPRTEP